MRTKRKQPMLSGLACVSLGGGIYCTATAAAETGTQWGWLLTGAVLTVVAVQTIVTLARAGR